MWNVVLVYRATVPQLGQVSSCCWSTSISYTAEVSRNPVGTGEPQFLPVTQGDSGSSRRLSIGAAVRVLGVLSVTGWRVLPGPLAAATHARVEHVADTVAQ